MYFWTSNERLILKILIKFQKELTIEVLQNCQEDYKKTKNFLVLPISSNQVLIMNWKQEQHL